MRSLLLAARLDNSQGNGRAPAANFMTPRAYAMQLGHQAINCTNGTINWKQIYGEESFKLKAPVYPSEYDAYRKGKQVDAKKMKELAEEWRKVRKAPILGHLLSYLSVRA